MLDKLINWYFNFLKKWYIVVLSVFLIISGFLGYFGTKIEMRSDFADLLSDDNPVIKNMRTVFDKFGGEGYLICTLEYKHEFYGIDDVFRSTDNIINEINSQLNKWDSYDKNSTTTFLPGIISQLHVLENTIKNNIKPKFVDLQLKLLNEKAKKFNKQFISELDKSVDILKSLYSILENTGNNARTGDNMLKALLKHLKIDDAGEAYNYVKNQIDEANNLTNSIKENIKINFINFKAMEKASDAIAKAISDKNLPEVKFISYRKPVRWMKDNFFYLIDYRDLVSLHNELKKIHLSAFRVLGSDKFQGMRDILNKYSVNISGSEDENQQHPVQSNPQLSSQSTTNPASSQTDRPQSDGEYEYRFNSFKDMLIFLIKPGGRSSDLEYSKNFINNIQKIVSEVQPSKFDKNIVYGFTGRYVKKVEDSEVLSYDIKFTSILAIILIIIVIYAYFRKIRAIFATMIPLLTGLMWALGIVYFAVGYFNIITGFIVAILSGLGIDFGIHMLARYYEERKDGRESIDALKKVFKTTLKATFTAASTTAFAFLCLVVTEFKGASQFGYTIFLGLMFIIVAMIVSFPCILILSEKLNPINIEKLQKGKVNTLSRLKGKKYPFPYAVAIGSFVLIIISFFYPPKFNFDFVSLRNTEGANLMKFFFPDNNKQKEKSRDSASTSIQNQSNTNSGQSQDSSDTLENRIGSTFNVSLWPSVLYIESVEASRQISEMLIRRSQLNKEFLKKIEFGHFFNSFLRLYNNPETFAENRLPQAAIDYLIQIRNETTLDILIRFIQNTNKSNWAKKSNEIAEIIDSIKKKIYYYYVKQYINNIASELLSHNITLRHESLAFNNTIFEEYAEFNFNDLNIPQSEETAGKISRTDELRLKEFFDMLKNSGINKIDEFLQKPYNYKKILKERNKLLSLIENSGKAQNAIEKLFFISKDNILIRFEFLKSFLKISTNFENFENFSKIKKYIIELLKDGYSNFEFHTKAALFSTYDNEITKLIKKQLIKLENEPEGDLFKALERPFNIIKIADSLRIIFDEIDSVARFVPADQEERKLVIKKIIEILNDNKFVDKIKSKKDKDLIKEAKKASKNLTGVSFSDLPNEISSRFKSDKSGTGTLIFIYPTTSVSISHTTSMNAYTNYLSSIRSTENKTVLFASETVIFTDILRILKRDGWLIILLTMASIIGLLLLDFKSLKALLFTNIPLLGGFALMFLFMKIFDVRINYLNAAVLPVILGVGIDEGIHIYHRYIEEGKKNLWYIVRTTGMAVFMADFTTAIGFMALMFANYNGLRTMGHLAFIGIMTAFVVSVTLLPALLQIIENYKGKRTGKKIDA